MKRQIVTCDEPNIYISQLYISNVELENSNLPIQVWSTHLQSNISKYIQAQTIDHCPVSHLSFSFMILDFHKNNFNLFLSLKWIPVWNQWPLFLTISCTLELLWNGLLRIPTRFGMDIFYFNFAMLLKWQLSIRTFSKILVILKIWK